MFNFTPAGFDCSEWCLEQHFTFSHNEIVKGLYIILIGLLVQLLAYFVYHHKDMLVEGEIITRDLAEILPLKLIEFSFLLDLGFILWALWFI